MLLQFDPCSLDACSTPAVHRLQVFDMFEIRVKYRLFARSRRVSVGTYDVFVRVRLIHVAVEVLSSVETCQQRPILR